MAIRTRLAFERVNESISFQSTTAYAVMVSGFGTLSRSTTPNVGRCCLFVGVRQPRMQVAVTRFLYYIIVVACMCVQ